MLLERWERVEELFREALDKDPAERHRWLVEAEREDPQLRAEVESLLEADAVAGDRLERLVHEGMDLASRQTFGLGSWIEGYELERELGRGGSSTVYLGVWRHGGRSKAKRVAVKVLRSEVRSTLARRRFLLEGKILARLDHPGIARLLSAGTVPDGRPYILMEYVEGEPLSEYRHRRRLSLGRRLQLFQEVCDAVQYAHSNLVVHQDLKPANILVTASGQTKLLDFGIARLVERQAGDPARQGDLTVTAARRLTPSYASPEQIRGEPLTTATDVFSLGVILYELLADRHPFRRGGQGAGELEVAILETEPRAPGGVLRRTGTAEARRRARHVQGDLERVVTMALAKERRHRYHSVEQLSEDLRRFQEGRPVMARRPTARYRARKFLARHWMGAAVTLAALVLLAVFATVSALQERQTARAWARADQEREKAEQALAFLVDTFEVAGPDRARGETVTAREILDHGAERIQAELDDQPEVQARLLEAMGRVYAQLGLYDRARPLLDEALRRHREIAAEPAGAAVGDPLALASTLRTLGDVQQKMGEYEAAEGVYREAWDIRRRELGERHAQVAESFNDLGDVLHDQGSYEAAEPLYERALALRRELFGEHHPDVAESLNNLALLYHERREPDRAEPLYRQALEMRRDLLRSDHPDLATSLANLASLVYESGRSDEAEPLFREAVAMNRRLHGDDGPEGVPALQNLALLLKDRGDLTEAEAILHRVLEIERRQFGEEHPNRATNLYHLGLVQREAERWDEAETLFRQAAELYRRTLSANHPWISFPLLTLGELYLRRGDPEGAEPLLRESVRLRREALGTDSPLTALAISALGDCFAATGRRLEAEPLLRESADLLEAAYGRDDRRAVWARDRVERWLDG